MIHHAPIVPGSEAAALMQAARHIRKLTDQHNLIMAFPRWFLALFMFFSALQVLKGEPLLFWNTLWVVYGACQLWWILDWGFRERLFRSLHRHLEREMERSGFLNAHLATAQGLVLKDGFRTYEFEHHQHLLTLPMERPGPLLVKSVWRPPSGKLVLLTYQYNENAEQPHQFMAWCPTRAHWFTLGLHEHQLEQLSVEKPQDPVRQP